MDKWGRRPILLSGAVGMCLALSSISYFMYIDVHFTPRMVVIFVIIYNAFFGYSWGPVPWLYPPEIMPLSIRAKGASLSTATNWAFNWLVGIMTPVLQDWIKWRLYLVHAFFCAVSFVLGKYPLAIIVCSRQLLIPVTVWFVYPETKGIQLEEMDAIFGDQSVVATPATARQSLLHPSRTGSPVPSLDIARSDGKRSSSPTYRKDTEAGWGGWVMRMFGRKTEGEAGGNYRRLDEGDDV